LETGLCGSARHWSSPGAFKENLVDGLLIVHIADLSGFHRSVSCSVGSP
jgi:hypothetical protein